MRLWGQWKRMLAPGWAAGKARELPVYLEQHPALDDLVVIQWSAGAHIGRVDLADAVLADATPPEQLRRIIGYCARRKLPVGAWLLSGVWGLGARPERLAAWLVALNAEAGPALVWVDSFAMPPDFKRRLGGHLRRAGCRVDGEPAR